MNIQISDIFLFSIATAWLIFATIADIKKREVPNWLSFSLITIALAIRALTALITNKISYFSYGIIAFVLFFLLTNILYYIKFFGGGDAKLLTALATVFATSPSFIKSIQTQELIQEPFLLNYLINIFAIGSFYSLAFIIFFAIKNKKEFSKEFKKINKKNKLIKICFAIFAAICFVLALLIDSVLFAPLFILVLIIPYIFAIAKAAENSSMIKQVSPKELTEGDWLVNEVKVGKKIIKPSVHGLDSEEIALLKKHNKKVLIKYGIPFVPVFFIALIFTILFGNLLFFIIKAFFKAFFF